jgi:hypothetical protein
MATVTLYLIPAQIIIIQFIFNLFPTAEILSISVVPPVHN